MRPLCFAILALGLCVFALGCKKRTDSTAAGDKDTGGTSGPAASGSGKRGTFTVGKSTTFVTGPVDSTGHVDYAAALNERLSKGVTPENNANVALWKILGPNPVGAKMPAGYFEKLKMTAPPATGDYFVGLRAYSDRAAPGQADAAFDALGKLSSRPWTNTENATLAGWIQANDKSLAALREAVKKTHYYNPIIPERGEKGSKGMMSALLPGAQASRELAGALACRAMLYLGHNQPGEAWQDLMACHRLGRLVGRGGALIEGLVGMAIEAIACRGEVAYLDRGRPDAKTVEACLRELMTLPALPDVAEKIDNYERFQLLETVMLVDQNGVSHLLGATNTQPAQTPFGDNQLDGIDWNPALENANNWFDRLAAATREKDRAKRNRELDQIEADLRNLKSSVGPGALQNAASAADRGKVIGDIFITLLMPAARKVVDAGDRTRQTFDTVVVGFACVWHQRFTGKYPAKLADLAPTYLSQVPKDLFTGNDLIYRPDANGFLLYSVGVNGRDDGGRTYTDQPPGDDLVVRIPQPLR